MHNGSCLPLFFENLEEFSCCQTDNLSGVKIAETADEIFVEVPVPGCTEDQIQITYEKEVLLIEAKEKVEKQEGLTYLLDSSRDCSYRIPLPSRIDEQSSPEATHQNGLLKIRFQKTKAARPIKISLKK